MHFRNRKDVLVMRVTFYETKKKMDLWSYIMTRHINTSLPENIMSGKMLQQDKLDPFITANHYIQRLNGWPKYE